MIALRRSDWDKFINEFMATANAADRFAQELAQKRITASDDERILNNEIERLRAGISACIEFTPDSEVREMLEALIRGEGEEMPE